MIETLAANGLIPQHFHFGQAKQSQCKLKKQKKFCVLLNNLPGKLKSALK